jgi:hypothetical protein
MTQDDREATKRLCIDLVGHRLVWPESLLDDFLDSFKEDGRPRGLTCDQYLMALLFSQNVLAKQYGMDLGCSVDWDEVEKHKEALGIRELKPEDTGV